MARFDVSTDGIRKLVASRPKSGLLNELVQNVFDTNATTCAVRLAPAKGKTARDLVEVVVEDDDPQGFHDLSHAWTMFAESAKKGLPEKRGRFNLGEKLVIAMCERAEVASTTGTVVFEKDTRRETKQCLPQGSRFWGLIPMTKEELAEALAGLRRILVPDGVALTLNGERLPSRVPLHAFKATLYTEVADKAGVMQKAARATTVTVYEPLPGEVPFLYELGLPVVATEDRWHTDIAQKVPLSMERDNVSPAWLLSLRVQVMNEMHTRLGPQDMMSEWVQEATSDARCAPAAVEAMLDARFGRDRVAVDPTDPEAVKIAQSQGRQVLFGASITPGQWDNAKKHGLVQPAGKVTPSPKPYGEDGKAEPKWLDPAKMTGGLARLAVYARDLGGKLLDGALITVRFANDTTWSSVATYGRGLDERSGEITFNVGRLGYAWFDRAPTEVEVGRLLIHEFAHHLSSDHLSSDYHEACCLLGARFGRLALDEPAFFEVKPLAWWAQEWAAARVRNNVSATKVTKAAAKRGRR
jgi:hypothetical protein